MRSIDIGCQKDIIKKWLERCQVLIAAHAVATRRYRSYHYVFGIGIIIITGAMMLPPVGKVSAYLSAIVVVLASILTFLNFNDTAERHRTAAKSYGEIIRLLETQLALEQADCMTLRQIQDQINKVNREAPEIPLKIFQKEDSTIKEEIGSTVPKLVTAVTFHSLSITPAELKVEHYKLEAEYFGKYVSCPETFEHFKESYEDKNLVICEARIGGKLVGYCVYENISNELYHMIIIIVKESLRRHGIGRRLIEDSCERLASIGVRYVSLFTAEELLINRIFRAAAQQVGTGSELNEGELLALRAIEKHRRIASGEYGNHRKVSRYYAMRDGRTLDAVFKLYSI